MGKYEAFGLIWRANPQIPKWRWNCICRWILSFCNRLIETKLKSIVLLSNRTTFHRNNDGGEAVKPQAGLCSVDLMWGGFQPGTRASIFTACRSILFSHASHARRPELKV